MTRWPDDPMTRSPDHPMTRWPRLALRVTIKSTSGNFCPDFCNWLQWGPCPAFRASKRHYQLRNRRSRGYRGMLIHVLLFCSFLGLTSCTVFLGLLIAASRRFKHTHRVSAPAAFPRVSILKPVHGLEPG